MSSLTRPAPRIPTYPAIANGRTAAIVVITATGTPTVAAGPRPDVRLHRYPAASAVARTPPTAAVVAWPGRRSATPASTTRVAIPYAAASQVKPPASSRVPPP